VRELLAGAHGSPWLAADCLLELGTDADTPAACRRRKVGAILVAEMISAITGTGAR
jgi:hypothetical protein